MASNDLLHDVLRRVEVRLSRLMSRDELEEFKDELRQAFRNHDESQRVTMESTAADESYRQEVHPSIVERRILGSGPRDEHFESEEAIHGPE